MNRVETYGAVNFQPVVPNPVNNVRCPTKEESQCYQHYSITSCLLLPSLFFLFVNHSSVTPILTLIYTLLILYAFHLTFDNRNQTLNGIWVGFGVSSLVLLACIAGIWSDNSECYKRNIFECILWGIVEVAILFCLACLGVLKFQWIPPTYAIQTERRLHAILPLASSSILSRELFNFWEDQNIYPYAFGVFLYFGIALSANTISSYCKPERNAIDPIHSITKLDGCILTCTLLFCPVLMYIYLVFSEENVSFSFTVERVCEILLVTSGPFLLHHLLEYKGLLWWKQSLPGCFSTNTSSKIMFRNIFLPLFASIIAILSFQFRYLIPLSTSLFHRTHGRKMQVSWITSCILIFVGVLILATFWFHKKRNSHGELSNVMSFHHGPSTDYFRVNKTSRKRLFQWLLPCYLSILSVSMIVSRPLIDLLNAQESTFNVKSLLFYDIIGCSSCLWGILMIFLMNHYLPDDGSEVLKRVAAFALLFFPGISFAVSSTSPFGNDNNSSYSSLTSVLHVGCTLIGLILVVFAIPLSLVGPSNYSREKGNNIQGFHLIYLVMFSITLGFGVSCFLTVQLMEGASIFMMTIVTASTTPISSIGIICCAEGYKCDTKYFNQVQIQCAIWIVALHIYFLVTLRFEEENMNLFGLNGWLSTFLTISAFNTFAFTLALKCRREKSVETCGAGNFFCILTWIQVIVAIHGQYGIASIGVSTDYSYVLGMPVSLIYSLVSSSILLLYEREASKTLCVSRTKVPTLGFLFKPISRNTVFILPIFAFSFVCIIISLYTIFLRGCTGSVYKNYEEMFATYLSEYKGSGVVDNRKDVHSIVLQKLDYTKTTIIAARLAGVGIWTSKDMVGPLFHTAGVLAILPVWILVLSQLKRRVNQDFFLPGLLNIFPLIFCNGIPALSIVACLGICISICQINVERTWKSRI